MLESLSHLEDGPSSPTATPFNSSSRSLGYRPPPVTPPSPSKRPRTSATTSPRKRRKLGPNVRVEPSKSFESEEGDEVQLDYEELDGRDSSILSGLASAEPDLRTTENDPFGILPVPSTADTPQSPFPFDPNPLGSPIDIPGPPWSHSPSEIVTPRPSVPPRSDYEVNRVTFQDLDEGHDSVDLSVGQLWTSSLTDTASNQSAPIEWSPTSSQAARSRGPSPGRAGRRCRTSLP